MVSSMLMTSGWAFPDVPALQVTVTSEPEVEQEREIFEPPTTNLLAAVMLADGAKKITQGEVRTSSPII